MKNLRHKRITVPKAHSEGVVGIQNIKEAELSVGRLTLILATTGNPDEWVWVGNPLGISHSAGITHGWGAQAEAEAGTRQPELSTP